MTSDSHRDAGERPAGTNRRTFIKRATAAGVSLSVPGVLPACGSTSPVASGSGSAAGNLGPAGLPLARANNPVTLPIYADNKAIASGLSPEKGPLELYNWIAYMNPRVITDFEKKYHVKVRLSTFVTIEEAITKLTSGQVQYDVFWPTAGYIEELVAGKIVQPINHSYIPNLSANVWPSLQNPWYDQGSRYTVPYTVYTTGIGWRADKLPNFNPDKLANPWNALWQVGPTIKGRVGMLDDERDGIAMALLRNGITDINTSSAKNIDIAKNSMVQLINSTNLKFDTNEYQRLADGELWLHEAWSGDMAASPSYAPKGTPASVLRYWWPGTGKGASHAFWWPRRGCTSPGRFCPSCWPSSSRSTRTARAACGRGSRRGGGGGTRCSRSSTIPTTRARCCRACASRRLTWSSRPPGCPSGAGSGAVAGARLGVGEPAHARSAGDPGARHGRLPAPRVHPDHALVPFSLIHLGTPAQIIGQVTFSVSYVVVIVRSRLASIGGEYEEAARDLGATRWGALRLVLLPLLLPAILASMLIVFALSIDDFVVTQYMSAGYSTITIPMYLYANARGGATTPALNALATILVVTTLVGIGAAYLVYTLLTRRTAAAESSALAELSGLQAPPA
jgi:spermidine/putrescine transport system substrate-binding protein